jgi:hypothetical protein
MTPQTSLQDMKYKAEGAVRDAAPWVETMARFGYAAKGTVYAVIGFLAAQAAFTSGGKTTDGKGALVTIIQQPFGRFLLGLVLLGLIGYVIWRLVQAFMNPENKGALTRAGFFVSAMGYGGLAIAAGKLVMGAGKPGGDTAQSATAQLMSQPLGQWMVAIVGLIFAGLGISQIVKGWKADFHEQLKVTEMSPTERKYADITGRVGLISRGIVFGIIGLFLVQAARTANPKEAKGIGDALRMLEKQAYGPWLMGLVALGLIAYGIFMFVEARYRHIEVKNGTSPHPA